jgi:hypothetical protein
VWHSYTPSREQHHGFDAIAEGIDKGTLMLVML